MQKNLYLIGGTMGVGKTAACLKLNKKLDNCVFLDGDWCWFSENFPQTNETKAMVVENICFLLNNFIKCSAYENIVFCWVMHEQSIIEQILSCVETDKCRVSRISLVCSAEALRLRLEKDVQSGARKTDIIEKSLARLRLYNELNTVKIDNTFLFPDETAEDIIEKSRVQA